MKKDIIVGSVIVLVVVVGVLIVKKNIITPPPTTFAMQVPFSSQAPNNNWSRNEDCEETSITMANAYLTGSTEDKLNTDAAQFAINTLKKWEQDNLGYNANTGIDATTKMAEGAFGLKVKQVPNFTEQDLKTELLNRHPILLALNARLLGNPKYQDSGPLYHMIVLRGYNQKGFFVNDPGTDGGDGSTYSFDVLKNASADWNNVTKAMETDRKIALVLSK